MMLNQILGARSVFICLSLALAPLASSQPLTTESDKIKQLKSQLPQTEGTHRVDLLNEICDEYEMVALDSSIRYASNALQISEELGYTEGVIISMNNVGFYHHEKSNYNQALKDHNAALAMAQHANNRKLESHCWNFIARVYRSQLNVPKAIECFLKSMEIRNELGDTKGLAIVSGNLGYLYWSLKDYDNADKYLTQALEIDEALGDSLSIGSDYLNLGLLYQKRGDLETAIDFSSRAMRIFTTANDWDGVSILYGNISLMLSEQGKYEEAMTYLHKSLKMKTELIKKPKSLAYTYGNFQKIYFDHGKYAKSVESGLETMAYLKEYPNNEVAQRVLKRLADAYAILGEYKNSHQYLEQYLVVKDSIFDTEKSRQAEQLKAVYESNQKDLTIAQQEGEIKLIAASNLFNTRLSLAAGTCLLLLFGGIYFYRSYRFALRSKEMEEAFSRQLLIAHENERKRISQDLHDSVGQSLILIKNKISLNQDPSTTSMVSKALEEVRSISKALHPAILDKLGLTASIQKLIEDADEHTGIFFSEEIEPIDGIFTPEQELQVYRIFQESMNNLIKHSQTKSALVVIQNQPKKATLEVRDFGVGFDLTEDTRALEGLGMKTLKERTQLLAGKILIDSTRGKGTSVILHINKPAAHV